MQKQEASSLLVKEIFKNKKRKIDGDDYDMDYNAIRELVLNHGADPNMKHASVRNFTALHMFCSRYENVDDEHMMHVLPKIEEVFRFLLSCTTKEDGEEINKDSGLNLVHMVARSIHSLRLSNCFLAWARDRKVNLNIPTLHTVNDYEIDVKPDMIFPLYYVVVENKNKEDLIPRLNLWLESGADPNFQFSFESNDEYKRRIFMKEKSNTPFRSIASYYAARSKLQNKIGETIDEAINVFKVLIEHDANPNIKCGSGERTVMHDVASFLLARPNEKYEYLCDYLIRKGGGNVNVEDKENRTPFYFARVFSNDSFIKVATPHKKARDEKTKTRDELFAEFMSNGRGGQKFDDFLYESGYRR